MFWEIFGAVILGVLVGGALCMEILNYTRFIPLIQTILEKPPPFNVLDALPDSNAKQVTFSTSDGLQLSGHLFRQHNQTTRGVVIFCHEYSGNQWMDMRYCEGLWEAGFDIFAFDFRNHGESESLDRYKPLHWPTDFEVVDVQAAIDFVVDHDDLKSLPIGIMSVSRGAGAALVAVANDSRIDCIACDGVSSIEQMMLHFAQRWITVYVPSWYAALIPNWYLKTIMRRARQRAGRQRGCRYAVLDRWLPVIDQTPVLLINGARDSYVLPEMAERLLASLGSEQKELWVVPEATHNLSRETATEEYDNRLVSFFKRMSQSNLETE